MRILFVARHYTYFRNYDSALRALASRGHHVHLTVQMRDAVGGEQAIHGLIEQYPQITHGVFPDDETDARRHLSRGLRLGLDYLPYLDDFYDDAPLRRVRARERTPRALIHLAELPLGGGWRRRVGNWLQALDQAIAPPNSMVQFLREQRPDVVLITPLVDLGSSQIHVLRAARSLGIPTGLCVWSWDHLSSKAHLREYPERIFVWNDSQKREAIEIHRASPSRLRVTGAQNFDEWFERRPSRTREEFCRDMGLPVDRAFVMWVCSALVAGSPPEADYVLKWLKALRTSSSSRLAHTAVVVRPYPTQMAEWDGVNLDSLQPVAVRGGNPAEPLARNDYFDTLYHSGAVVGINTTALIEAAIVGRPVLTILPPRFHDTQKGSAHFQYLLNAGGGLVQVADDIPAHLAQLERSLDPVSGGDHPHRAFLEAFVRPRGLEQAATPVFVDEVEALARETVSLADRVVVSNSRALLVAGLAALTRKPWMAFAVQSPRERDSETRMRTVEAEKSVRRAEHQAAADRRRAERNRRVAGQRAAREEALREKVEDRKRKAMAVPRGRPAPSEPPTWRGAAAMRALVRSMYRRLVGSDPDSSELR